MSELVEKNKMLSNLKMPQNNGEKKEKLLLFFNENEELSSIEVIHHLHGLDENSDDNKAMIGVILNERKNIIAIIYYHVRHGEEGEPGLNLLKAVQVFMADRIVKNILKIKVGLQFEEISKINGFPFEEIFKMNGMRGQVVNCYFHMFKGNEYLHSRLGYIEKDKLDKMSSRCYKFIYEIEKIPYSKINSKVYDEYCNNGRFISLDLTDSKYTSQAPASCKKSLSTGKKFKGNEVAVVCSEVKFQKPNVRAKNEQISSYLLGFLIGLFFNLNFLVEMFNAIFYSH